VKELVNDPVKLMDFYRQDVFMPDAYEVMNVDMHGAMMRMMDEIRSKLR
jgi:hypothetical protein